MLCSRGSSHRALEKIPHDDKRHTIRRLLIHITSIHYVLTAYCLRTAQWLACSCLGALLLLISDCYIHTTGSFQRFLWIPCVSTHIRKTVEPHTYCSNSHSFWIHRVHVGYQRYPINCYLSHTVISIRLRQGKKGEFASVERQRSSSSSSSNPSITSHWLSSKREVIYCITHSQCNTLHHITQELNFTGLIYKHEINTEETISSSQQGGGSSRRRVSSSTGSGPGPGPGSARIDGVP
jgi:hypothetical protein